MQQAAFFDLDKTVIAKSSTLAFGKPLYKAGLLGRRTLMKIGFGQLFYMLFGADQDALDRARDQMLQLTAGWHRAEIEQLVEETLEQVADPLVYAEALFLIDEHKRQGRRVFLVSASPDVIVKPIAHHVEVDEVIATRVMTDAHGRFLPELEFFAQGESKAVAIRDLAEREEIDLAGSYAYSDSHTDLPMMEAVGNPVAVNPERDLRKVAEERGWPILEFQRQVSLRTRLVKPVPLISGATVAGLVAGAVVLLLLRRKPGR
jgi:HAD superfamily hydrolase (TIGR01490 family)